MLSREKDGKEQPKFFQADPQPSIQFDAIEFDQLPYQSSYPPQQQDQQQFGFDFPPSTSSFQVDQFPSIPTAHFPYSPFPVDDGTLMHTPSPDYGPGKRRKGDFPFLSSGLVPPMPGDFQSFQSPSFPTPSYPISVTRPSVSPSAGIQYPPTTSDTLGLEMGGMSMDEHATTNLFRDEFTPSHTRDRLASSIDHGYDFIFDQRGDELRQRDSGMLFPSAQLPSSTSSLFQTSAHPHSAREQQLLLEQESNVADSLLRDRMHYPDTSRSSTYLSSMQRESNEYNQYSSSSLPFSASSLFSQTTKPEFGADTQAAPISSHETSERAREREMQEQALFLNGSDKLLQEEMDKLEMSDMIRKSSEEWRRSTSRTPFPGEGEEGLDEESIEEDENESNSVVVTFEEPSEAVPEGGKWRTTEEDERRGRGLRRLPLDDLIVDEEEEEEEEMDELSTPVSKKKRRKKEEDSVFTIDEEDSLFSDSYTPNHTTRKRGRGKGRGRKNKKVQEIKHVTTKHITSASPKRVRTYRRKNGGYRDNKALEISQKQFEFVEALKPFSLLTQEDPISLFHSIISYSIFRTWDEVSPVIDPSTNSISSVRSLLCSHPSFVLLNIISNGIPADSFKNLYDSSMLEYPKLTPIDKRGARYAQSVESIVSSVATALCSGKMSREDIVSVTGHQRRRLSSALGPVLGLGVFVEVIGRGAPKIARNFRLEAISFTITSFIQYLYNLRKLSKLLKTIADKLWGELEISIFRTHNSRLLSFVEIIQLQQQCGIVPRNPFICLGPQMLPKSQIMSLERRLRSSPSSSSDGEIEDNPISSERPPFGADDETHDDILHRPSLSISPSFHSHPSISPNTSLGTEHSSGQLPSFEEGMSLLPSITGIGGDESSYQIVSVEAKDLIKRLLEKDPHKRLGSMHGGEEIQYHGFFKGMERDFRYVIPESAIEELKPKISSNPFDSRRFRKHDETKYPRPKGFFIPGVDKAPHVSSFLDIDRMDRTVSMPDVSRQFPLSSSEQSTPMCSSEFDDDAFVPRTTSSSTSYSTPMSVSKQSHLTSEFGSQVIIIDEDDDEDEGLEMECDMRHID
ncbi:hypothetical protein ADUPG1_009694, partial [Aduncisulcus paluster]